MRDMIPALVQYTSQIAQSYASEWITFLLLISLITSIQQGNLSCCIVSTYQVVLPR